MTARLGRIVVALALLAVAVTTVLYLMRPRPVPVESALVTRGPLAESVEVESKTRVRERYSVAAPVAGRLLRLPWREGDHVQAGAVIARIDPLPSTAAVTQAIAQLRELKEQQVGVETLRPKPEAIAQAQSRIAGAAAEQRAAQEKVQTAAAKHDQAVRDARRAEGLERSGSIPRVDLEAALLAETSSANDLRIAQHGLAAAAAEVQNAHQFLAEVQAKRFDPDYLRRVYAQRIAGVEAQLTELEDRASRTTIRSPASGTVLRVVQKSELFVAAGATLMELADTRQLEIVADVLSPDAVKMRKGDDIIVVRGAGDRRLRGRVRLVEPSGYTKVSALGIEEQRVNVIGDFVDPPTGLGDQFRLDVQIVTWRKKDVVRVPSSALFRCSSAWCAFVVDQRRAKRVVVRTGHQGEDDAEVLDGLRPDQRVILHPSDRINDGTLVDASAA